MTPVSALNATDDTYEERSPMNKPQASTSFVRDGKLRIPTAAELGFDPEEMRRKYAHERDRRLRPDGAAQYQDIEGDLYRYNDDPHVTERLVRDPVTETVEVAILGGGFGGMLMAARLERAGVRDFRIIERAGVSAAPDAEPLPGAQCDGVYIYLPLLDETGYMPELKYSFQPRSSPMRSASVSISILPACYFQTQVRELRWDERTLGGDDRSR